MENTNNNKIISLDDLKWFLNSIIKNWFVFLVLISTFSFIGVLYNFKQKKFYKTKIEVLLKSNDVYDYQENLQSNLGVYNYYGDISNQKRVIGSYDMIQKVLKKLDLSCSYFIVGRLNTKEFFNELPFKVDVNVLNSNLFEIPIDFKIINKFQYEVNYVKRKNF